MRWREGEYIKDGVLHQELEKPSDSNAGVGTIICQCAARIEQVRASDSINEYLEDLSLLTSGH